MKNKINITAIVIAIITAFGIGYFLAPKTTQTLQHSELQHDRSVETIYTCSMHPQIRQNEPGDCPICGMDLIPLDANNSSNDNPLVLEMTPNAVTMASITTSVVGEDTNDSGADLQLTGKIQADESTTASIVTHIPGRIEKLYIRFTGERIKKGDRIATIYSPDLIAAQKELLEANKIKDISPTLLDAAKNKMKYLKISERQIEQILASDQVQENFDIYAEYSGVVTKRNVAVSDYLRAGSILFEIQDLSKLWAVFDIYENQLSKLHKGKAVRFTTSAIPNKTFKAVIDFVDPLIRPDTRTASARATIRNTNGQLKPEMFISGKVKASAKSTKSSLSIPKTAVLWTGYRSVVYVKVPDMDVPSFEFREVKLGDMSGTNYLILSGLSIGEEIVTKGAFIIDASAQLNNQASMMNRKVTIKGAKPTKKEIPDYTNVSQKFKQQITDLAQAYLRLKVAFVKTNPEYATDFAQAFNQQLDQVNMRLVKDKAHVYWMQKLKVLDAHSNKITESSDIEVQRQQFQHVSDAMIETLKAFGSRDKLYVQHCPMAFDNQGADWISSKSNIMNPYFGDIMMRCGSVVDSL